MHLRGMSTVWKLEYETEGFIPSKRQEISSICGEGIAQASKHKAYSKNRYCSVELRLM
ncbi:hypothetical protein APHCRT_1062 [Anaplasma phagocytophilum str. CRT53-1]|uniref:Uncharacterized protein n=1 Tax=Anaplasma phagocytophilum str. CRT53-1 TaxID=1359157 RepID=A0A0F3PXQ0_ANAPH|nr:hypothetical protein APHCRT_1062 [Anaplasma phagocytophilum str. CRT53-1]